MSDYAKYEREANKVRKENEILLKDFAEKLQSTGLTKKTIDNHVENTRFFIDEFLLYYDVVKAKNGIHQVDNFLGNWFIRKTTWASQAHIKGTAASLKKFYTFLLDKRLIKEKELQELKVVIKENMSDWLSELQRFDDLIFEDFW